MSNPTPTKPPRLPKGRVLTAITEGDLSNYMGEFDLRETRSEAMACKQPYETVTPCAVIPCKSAREAKQIVKLFTEGRGGFLHGLARIDIDGGSAEHVANLALHYASEARKLLGDRK
jgi:hypothetical protein